MGVERERTAGALLSVGSIVALVALVLVATYSHIYFGLIVLLMGVLLFLSLLGLAMVTTSAGGYVFTGSRTKELWAASQGRWLIESEEKAQQEGMIDLHDKERMDKL
jgi:hypothetical protein